jgi:3-oxoacyl-[acyl-carrier protein] reductase
MKGRTTIVTGGSQGIGRAISEFLAEKGSDIAIFDVLDGTDVVQALEIKGVNARWYHVDVTDYQSVERAVGEVKKDFGEIDNLVNNAGITRDKLLLRMSEDDWDRVVSVNLKGVFTCTKGVLRYLLKKGGAIVNIASIAGLMGNAGQSNYSASKAGIIGFTKSIAKEYGERGIRVNAVAPGFIRTEMTAALEERFGETMLKSVPLRRPGDPRDVARVVYFLLSDYSGYITGEVINVSGGLYI